MKKLNETKDVITYELNDKTLVYVIKMLDTEQTYVEMLFKVGSFQLSVESNNKVINFPQGIAHFLEHMKFHMPDIDQFSLFSKNGFDANAITSYESTSYLFNATNDLDKGLDLLLEMCDKPYFNEEEIELERSIINEEIKMYDNDIQTNMFFDLINNMYLNHPIKYDIGGTSTSISEINGKNLEEFYNIFYQPKNRLLLICGKIDLHKLEKYFKKYENNNKNTILYKLETVSEPNDIIKSYEEKIKAVKIPKMMIGLKLHSDANIKESIVLDILLEMLFSKSSNFYEELVEKKLINRNFFYEANYYDQLFNVLIYGENNKINTLIKTLKKTLLNFNKFINEEDFKRLKKVYKARFIYSLNNPLALGKAYLRYQLVNIDYFELLNIIDEITFKDVSDFQVNIKEEIISTIVYKKA